MKYMLWNAFSEQFEYRAGEIGSVRPRDFFMTKEEVEETISQIREDQKISLDDLLVVDPADQSTIKLTVSKYVWEKCDV